MYCRKCGTKISDDSEYCNKCGTKVEKPVDADNSTQNVQPTEKPEPTEVPEMTEEEIKKRMRKDIRNVILLIAIPIVSTLLLCVFLIVTGELTCRYSWCFNRPVDGSSFCYEHMCEYPGCNRMKDTREIYGVEQIVPYCIVHICLERNCTEMTDEGVSFCKYHKCIVEDCNEKHMPGSEYCSSHANEW